MAFDLKKFQKEITDLQKEFISAYNSRAEASRVDKLRELKPGTPAPKTGKIYGDDHRDRFEEQAAELRARGFSAIDKAKAEIKRDMTAAPSSDAVNALAMLAYRTDVSQDEIDALIESYGGNYQTYSAIRDIAMKHKRFVPASTLEQDLSAINAKISIVNDMSLSGAEMNGSANPVRLAFMEWAEGLPRE